MDSESWDLEAVVRGGSFTDPATVDPFTSFPPLLQEDHEALPTSFPDLWESSGTALYELEELCRPFILKTLHQPSPPPQQQLNFFTSTATAASPSPCQPQKLRQTQRAQPQSSRSKRRKNQVKKVVCEVPVDGAPPDMWAWRKYGQKPIKGSPHPRGYYRCSSSKGCPARKQVERSRTDPSMLVITYTAEHSHPIPTHRSSLAGSTRHKFTPPLPSSSSPAHGFSPTTPLSANMDDDELLNQRPSKEEDEEVGYMDLIMDDDDLFGENLTVMDESKGGYFVESLFSPTWLVDGNAAAAAAGSS